MLSYFYTPFLVRSGFPSPLSAGDPGLLPALRHCGMLAGKTQHRGAGPSGRVRGGGSFSEKPADWWGSLSFKFCLTGGEVGRDGGGTKVGCEA